MQNDNLINKTTSHPFCPSSLYGPWWLLQFKFGINIDAKPSQKLFHNYCITENNLLLFLPFKHKHKHTEITVDQNMPRLGTSQPSEPWPWFLWVSKFLMETSYEVQTSTDCPVPRLGSLYTGSKLEASNANKTVEINARNRYWKKDK